MFFDLAALDLLQMQEMVNRDVQIIAGPMANITFSQTAKVAMTTLIDVSYISSTAIPFLQFLGSRMCSDGKEIVRHGLPPRRAPAAVVGAATLPLPGAPQQRANLPVNYGSADHMGLELPGLVAPWLLRPGPCVIFHVHVSAGASAWYVLHAKICIGTCGWFSMSCVVKVRVMLCMWEATTEIEQNFVPLSSIWQLH